MQTLILSFNKPNLTEKCIESVLKHVEPSKVSLIHNGSLKDNVDQLKSKYPKISHIEIDDNNGFSCGANHGLNKIFLSHEWAFFITNDCELISPPSTPEKPGLYAPLIYRRSLERVDSLGGYFNPIRKKLTHQRKIITQSKKSFFQYFYVPGTAFVVDRSTWTSLGGFDESLHTYWEDVDLSVRAYKKGHHLGVLPHLKLIHAVGKTCHKKKFYTEYLFQRNRKIISERYRPRILRPFVKTPAAPFGWRS